MRKKDKLKKTVVQSTASALASLGKKDSEEINRKTAANLLKAQVKKARARGATWAEISEILKDQGLDISTKTLARALDEDTKTRAEKGTKQAQKKAVAAPGKVPVVAPPPGAGAWGAVVPESGHHAVKPDRDNL